MTTRIAVGDGAEVLVTEPEEWLDASGRLSGEWEGATRNARVSVIANEIDEVGSGPAPHEHDYAEIFVVIEGNVRFTVGEATIHASTGHVIVAPPGIPHAFTNEGPGPLRMLDVHENRSFETRWMSDH
jgi:mannose-6-phosphate isomerase-like protein (cupin superfamily)